MDVISLKPGLQRNFPVIILDGQSILQSSINIFLINLPFDLRLPFLLVNNRLRSLTSTELKLLILSLSDTNKSLQLFNVCHHSTHKEKI